MIPIPSLHTPLTAQTQGQQASAPKPTAIPTNEAETPEKATAVLRILARRLARTHRPMLQYVGDKQVTYKNKKYPAVFLSVTRATKEADIALFKAGGVYVFMADLGGSKARKSFSGTRTGNVKNAVSKETGIDQSGIRTATAKTTGDGSMDIGGDAVNGRSVHAVATSARYSDFESLVGNKIQDIIHGTKLPDPNQTPGAVGVGDSGTKNGPVGNVVTVDHLTIGYHGQTPEMNLSEDVADATFVSFDFYGEGAGIYVAVDTIRPGKKSTLSDHFNESAEEVAAVESDWSSTTVEVVGPVPAGIDRIMTRDGWSAVTSVQAESRAEAVVLVSEAIETLGFSAQPQFGVIRVELKPEVPSEENTDEENRNDDCTDDSMTNEELRYRIWKDKDTKEEFPVRVLTPEREETGDHLEVKFPDGSKMIAAKSQMRYISPEDAEKLIDEHKKSPRCQFCEKQLGSSKPTHFDDKDLWPACKECQDSYPTGDDSTDEEREEWWAMMKRDILTDKAKAEYDKHVKKNPKDKKKD